MQNLGDLCEPRKSACTIKHVLTNEGIREVHRHREARHVATGAVEQDLERGAALRHDEDGEWRRLREVERVGACSSR